MKEEQRNQLHKALDILCDRLEEIKGGTIDITLIDCWNEETTDDFYRKIHGIEFCETSDGKLKLESNYTQTFKYDENGTTTSEDLEDLPDPKLLDPFIVVCWDPTNTLLDSPVVQVIKAESAQDALKRAMELDLEEAEVYKWEVHLFNY